jgi:hypothetical protein
LIHVGTWINVDHTLATTANGSDSVDGNAGTEVNASGEGEANAYACRRPLGQSETVGVATQSKEHWSVLSAYRQRRFTASQTAVPK